MTETNKISYSTSSTGYAGSPYLHITPEGRLPPQRSSTSPTGFMGSASAGRTETKPSPQPPSNVPDMLSSGQAKTVTEAKAMVSAIKEVPKGATDVKFEFYGEKSPSAPRGQFLKVEYLNKPAEKKGDFKLPTKEEIERSKPSPIISQPNPWNQGTLGLYAKDVKIGTQTSRETFLVPSQKDRPPEVPSWEFSLAPAPTKEEEMLKKVGITERQYKALKYGSYAGAGAATAGVLSIAPPVVGTVVGLAGAAGIVSSVFTKGAKATVLDLAQPENIAFMAGGGSALRKFGKMGSSFKPTRSVTSIIGKGVFNEEKGSVFVKGASRSYGMTSGSLKHGAEKINIRTYIPSVFKATTKIASEKGVGKHISDVFGVVEREGMLSKSEEPFIVSQVFAKSKSRGDLSKIDSLILDKDIHTPKSVSKSMKIGKDVYKDAGDFSMGGKDYVKTEITGRRLTLSASKKPSWRGADMGNFKIDMISPSMGSGGGGGKGSSSPAKPILDLGMGGSSIFPQMPNEAVKIIQSRYTAPPSLKSDIWKGVAGIGLMEKTKSPMALQNYRMNLGRTASNKQSTKTRQYITERTASIPSLKIFQGTRASTSTSTSASQTMKQMQRQASSLRSATKTLFGVSGPPKIPEFGIPPELPSMFKTRKWEWKAKKLKAGRRKRKSQYTLSYIGLMSGLKVRKIPGVIGGIEARFPIMSGRRRRRRRR